MAFIPYNANPFKSLESDCVIRAISTLTDDSWDNIYIDLSLQGFLMKSVPVANHVWGSYLSQLGYDKYSCTGSSCFTVKEFCKYFGKGRFLACTGTHVVAVIDGDYYDTWDSGNEIVDYYWKKETNQ